MRARPLQRPRGGRQLVAALFLVLVATGCSGGDRPVLRTTATVDPDIWSGRFCRAHRAWSTSLEAAGSTAAEAFALPGREANRAALVILFDTAAAATGALRSSIEGAGVPDVNGGTSLVSDLKTRLAGHQEALEALARAAAEVSVQPEDAFLAEVEELRVRYRAAQEAMGTAVEALGETAAGEALAPSVTDRCDVDDP